MLFLLQKKLFSGPSSKPGAEESDSTEFSTPTVDINNPS